MRRELASLPKRKAAFIEPMDCAPVSKLLDGPGWLFEIKLDGYRAIAVKADGRVNLFSRRRKSFDHHYPLIVEALAELPDGTVVDGEVVALDSGKLPLSELTLIEIGLTLLGLNRELPIRRAGHVGNDEKHQQDQRPECG